MSSPAIHTAFCLRCQSYNPPDRYYLSGSSEITAVILTLLQASLRRQHLKYQQRRRRRCLWRSGRLRQIAGCCEDKLFKLERAAKNTWAAFRTELPCYTTRNRLTVKPGPSLGFPRQNLAKFLCSRFQMGL